MQSCFDHTEAPYTKFIIKDAISCEAKNQTIDNLICKGSFIIILERGVLQFILKGGEGLIIYRLGQKLFVCNNCLAYSLRFEMDYLFFDIPIMRQISPPTSSRAPVDKL